MPVNRRADGGKPPPRRNAMIGERLNFESHRVGDVYRTLARTVSETDIVNFVNLGGQEVTR
jgi:hypothetical protein